MGGGGELGESSGCEPFFVDEGERGGVYVEGGCWTADGG